MDSQLEDLLLNYLGKLMHEQQSKFDWHDRDKVSKKINAVYLLLNIDKKEKTFMDTIKEVMKK